MPNFSEYTKCNTKITNQTQQIGKHNLRLKNYFTEHLRGGGGGGDGFVLIHISPLNPSPVILSALRFD